MKNIRLIAFFFFLVVSTGTLVCQGTTLFKDLSLDYSAGYDGDLNNSLKLTLPFMELRGALRNKKVITWPPDYNFGVMLDTQAFYKPASLAAKAGNLAAGGSLSLLNSPAFSGAPSPSGLDTALVVENLSASLPAKDNYTSPVSYFFECVYRGGNFLKKVALNCFIDEEKVTASSSFYLNPAKSFELSLCYSGGLFPLEKTRSDSWYLPFEYYGVGKHICMNVQTGLRTGSYNGIFTAGLYETPFSSYMAVWRLENQLRTKHFCAVLDFFYNANQSLITSSGKMLNPLLQVRGGGMVKFNSFTGGSGFLLDLNTTERLHSCKTQAGLKYESNVYKGNITGSLDLVLGNPGDHITLECPKGNIQNTNTICFKDFKLELSPKLYFERSSRGVLTYTEKLAFDFEYDGIIKAGCSVNFELKHKDNFGDKRFGWDSKVLVEGKIGIVRWSVGVSIKS